MRRRARRTPDASAEVTAAFRVNELLNWEVARAAAVGRDLASATRRRRRSSPPTRCSTSAADLADVVHRYGDPADEETGDLMSYLDAQAKRNLVLTFGGGVNEVQRELIAMFGLGLPRVPR